MTFRVLALVTTAMLGLIVGLAGKTFAQDYSYPAREERVIGHRDGQLLFSDRGVEFKAKGGKGSFSLAYPDIKLLEILGPAKVRIWTYEGRAFPPRKSTSFSFSLIGGEISPAVREFVSARIPRPMVTEVISETGEPEVQLSVEHLHRIGGCSGVLKVYPNSLVFEAAKGGDSRSWRWTDIQSISRLGPYRLEVLTYEPETGGPTRAFNFELKEPMSDQEYDLIWNGVFRPHPPAKGAWARSGGE